MVDIVLFYLNAFHRACLLCEILLIVVAVGVMLQLLWLLFSAVNEAVKNFV